MAESWTKVHHSVGHSMPLRERHLNSNIHNELLFYRTLLRRTWTAALPREQSPTKKLSWGFFSRLDKKLS